MDYPRFYADIAARMHLPIRCDDENGSGQRREQQARDSDINSEVPAFLASLFKRGLAAGYDEEDMTALIKTCEREDAKRQGGPALFYVRVRLFAT